MWRAGDALESVLLEISPNKRDDLFAIPDIEGWRISSDLTVFVDKRNGDFYSQLQPHSALHLIHKWAGPDLALWLEHNDGRKALFVIQTKNREHPNFYDAFESLQPGINFTIF